MTSDELFIHRAQELALNGLGLASPNPLVGCVIVHDGIIIGEGWHQKFGEPHAEVNAVNSVKDKSILKDSILFVNLEPCSHIGKTPPCADMIVSYGFKRVVVSNSDPNPLVSGKGIEILEKAGIEVKTGIMEQEGEHLNRRFFTYIKKKRPFVILKWAQTANGFIAKKNLDSKWISNEFSRQLVHKWRSEEDSILVGYNTAVHDNPKLTTRDWPGKNPLRIVIDEKLELKRSLHLLDQSVPTLCFNFKRQEEAENLSFIKIKTENVAEQILLSLYERGIQSVVVEGGAHTINLFLNSNLWDEARVFMSNKVFDYGIKSPELKINEIRSNDILGDRLRVFENRNF